MAEASKPQPIRLQDYRPPDWLIDLVVKRKSPSDPPSPGATPEQWRSFIDDSYEGSRRGHAVARLAGLLLRRYIDPYVALSICQLFNMHRCREPLTWNSDRQVVGCARTSCQSVGQSGGFNGAPVTANFSSPAGPDLPAGCVRGRQCAPCRARAPWL